MTLIASEWLTLLPLATAMGASLYLTLLLLAVVSLIPGLPSLPGQLSLLETPSVAVAAALLFLAGWILRHFRWSELIWESANVGIRALSASLLALLLLAGEAPLAQGMGALLAGSAAATVQGVRLGWATLHDQREELLARKWIEKLGADTVALGLLWLAILRPAYGALISSIVLLLLLSLGLPAIRAARFSMILLTRMVLFAVRGAGWARSHGLPRWVRASLGRESGIDFDTLRGAPAALLWPEGIASFRDGWLVATASGPLFLFRSWSRLWEVRLEGARVEERDRHPYLTELHLRDGEGSLTLLLPRGGPAPAELDALFGAAQGVENL